MAPVRLRNGLTVRFGRRDTPPAWEIHGSPGVARVRLVIVGPVNTRSGAERLPSALRWMRQTAAVSESSVVAT